MNERTAQLLRKWASVSRKKEREVKAWWNSLTVEQRTRQRRIIKAQVEKNA
jgi:hypothetical protein